MESSPALLPNKEAIRSSPLARTQQKAKRTRLLVPALLAALVVVVLAVVLPVYFLVIKKNNSPSTDAAAAPSSSASSGAGGPSGGSTNIATTGADGSTVVTVNGDTFLYNNSFGGYWVADPANPLAGGRANSWTPLLNETWTWGVDHVYGVNLGGWFVLEPFIVPALFQAYPSASDEWSLSTLMLADGTLQEKMEAHYDTFITEQDIAQIAGAGLNWIRLPIPFWAISTWSDVGTNAFPDSGTAVAEPFLEGVCWKYIVRLFTWARKYGIRVNIDLHTIPGSQNGYNHSGKGGQINFLNGPMGVANAQRAVDYIRIITEFIAQEQWQDVVQMFGVVNEARMKVIGQDPLYAFYLQVHDMIRNITGIGAGHGPYISVHDGFEGISSWAGFLPGSDRVILDTHPYTAFNGQPNTAPIATGTDPNTAGGSWAQNVCDYGANFNQSRSAFGVTVAGEWSVGYNDCGLYLNGVNGSATYGGDCDFWEDSSTWNASVKAGLHSLAASNMDAFGDWFFWTWKVGEAADGVVRSPLWSYQAGLAGGWMPTDPRTATGHCVALGIEPETQFDGTYSAWQTGGAGAGTIAQAATQQWGQWPPLTLSNADGGVLPAYTATATVPTLGAATPAAAVTGAASASVAALPTASFGSGWADAQDTALAIAPVSGCVYPNAWNAVSLPAPAATCG